MYLHAPVPSRKLMITVYSYGNQCMRKQCDSLIFPTAVECHILFVCWYPPGSASTAHMMSVQLLHHLASVWYLGCTCFVGSRLLASAHPPSWYMGKWGNQRYCPACLRLLAAHSAGVWGKSVVRACWQPIQLVCIWENRFFWPAYKRLLTSHPAGVSGSLFVLACL